MGQSEAEICDILATCTVGDRPEALRRAIGAHFKDELGEAAQTEYCSDERTLVGDKRLGECAVASIQVGDASGAQKIKVLDVAVCEHQPVLEGREGQRVRGQRRAANVGEAGRARQCRARSVACGDRVSTMFCRPLCSGPESVVRGGGMSDRPLRT